MEDCNVKFEVIVETNHKYAIEVEAISPHHARTAAWAVLVDMTKKDREHVQQGVGLEHNRGSWPVSVVEPTPDERIKAAAEKLDIILDEGQFAYSIDENDCSFILFGKTTYFIGENDLADTLEPLAELAHVMLKRCIKAADDAEQKVVDKCNE